MNTNAMELEKELTFSNKCGVTLSDSVEGRVIAQVMAGKPNVQITRFPALIRIDGIGRLEFRMDEISEALGKEFDPYTFQIEMSTHYGKMILLDDMVLLLASPDDARAYLGI